MAVNSVLLGMVVIAMDHAAGSINVVLRAAMVPTKQLTIARTKGRDSQKVWALPAVPHGTKRRNPF